MCWVHYSIMHIDSQWHLLFDCDLDWVENWTLAPLGIDGRNPVPSAYLQAPGAAAKRCLGSMNVVVVPNIGNYCVAYSCGVAVTTVDAEP